MSNCHRGSGTPNLNGSKAQAVGLLNLPDNSNQFVNFPGCQYTGDTRIKFNSDGTMTVWNKGGVSGTNCGYGQPACQYQRAVRHPGAHRPGDLRPQRGDPGQVHGRPDR